MAKIKGHVKWFNAMKRLGYITDEEGNDHFVHASGIEEGRMYPGFADGDEVEFEVSEGRKGPQAVGVKLLRKVEDIKKEEKDKTAEKADE